MVSPNLAVVFLFVALALARRQWESDRSNEATALRRAHLSPVQVSRKSQMGLFHSTYIPMRPSGSRCFVNTDKEPVRSRGPPAY